MDDGRTGERVTPHISKPGWEYLEINEITVPKRKRRVVGEAISILLRIVLECWNVWRGRLNNSR